MFSYYFASVLNRSQMSLCGYIFLFENDMQNILECIFLAYNIIKQEQLKRPSRSRKLLESD